MREAAGCPLGDVRVVQHGREPGLRLRVFPQGESLEIFRPCSSDVMEPLLARPLVHSRHRSGVRSLTRPSQQYLLLGGLEQKYGAMPERVIEGDKRSLLYRPMTSDSSRDILFAGKLTSNGEPEVDAQRVFEVTHLTCFLGGMFGL